MCLALSACSVSPSRSPLGGNYAAPESAPSPNRRAPQALAAKQTTPSDGEAETESTPVKPVLAATPVVAEVAAAKARDTVTYQPLKAGDLIKGEVTLGFDAELHGGPPGMFANSKFQMDSKLRVELKISKVSTHSIDEVQLTVTTLSMHSEFAGHAADAKPEPPEVYDVTLGQSPSIRARNASKPGAEDRALLLALVAPIADFHERWAGSPTLDLEPGWSSKVPVTLPTFPDGHAETIHVGPLAVRYAGRTERDRANDSVPFDLTLPIQYEYGADQGKLELEFSGKTTLSAASGRPTSIDLSGPFSAAREKGPFGATRFTGTTKFSASLSYQ
ncbi:MAG: hypothetical protein ABW061_27315 [Polyangiaceae bacterium]